MADTLQDYFDALDRLTKGQPKRVTKGTKINNDAVALEAGRKKGTIKKSRPIFHDLIVAIKSAASSELKPSDEGRAQLSLAKAEAKKYRVLWEDALCREISLVKQLWRERKEWADEKAALTGEKVSVIRARHLRAKPDDSL